MRTLGIVAAILSHRGIQGKRRILQRVKKADSVQSSQQQMVTELLEGIQVGAQGAFKL